jgi:hypothetical protein
MKNAPPASADNPNLIVVFICKPHVFRGARSNRQYDFVPCLSFVSVAVMLFSMAMARPSKTTGAPGVLAEAAHKTGRAKADFELREISKEEYNKVKGFI